MLKPSAETLWARRLLAIDPKFAHIVGAVEVTTAPGARIPGGCSVGEVVPFHPAEKPTPSCCTGLVDRVVGGTSPSQVTLDPDDTTPGRIAQ